MKFPWEALDLCYMKDKFFNWYDRTDMEQIYFDMGTKLLKLFVFDAQNERYFLSISCEEVRPNLLTIDDRQRISKANGEYLIGSPSWNRRFQWHNYRYNGDLGEPDYERASNISVTGYTATPEVAAYRCVDSYVQLECLVTKTPVPLDNLIWMEDLLAIKSLASLGNDKT
jgi:hypothetical protein